MNLQEIKERVLANINRLWGGLPIERRELLTGVENEFDELERELGKTALRCCSQWKVATIPPGQMTWVDTSDGLPSDSREVWVIKKKWLDDVHAHHTTDSFSTYKGWTGMGQVFAWRDKDPETVAMLNRYKTTWRQNV